MILLFYLLHTKIANKVNFIFGPSTIFMAPVISGQTLNLLFPRFAFGELDVAENTLHIHIIIIIILPFFDMQVCVFI